MKYSLLHSLTHSRSSWDAPCRRRRTTTTKRTTDDDDDDETRMERSDFTQAGRDDETGDETGDGEVRMKMKMHRCDVPTLL